MIGEPDQGTIRVLLVEDEAFTRYAPDEGFQCEDDYVAELEGDYSASG